MAKERKPRIKDIAQRLDVSTTTVTKALRGLPKVSEEMRRKVLAVAEEVGYKPSRMAQALAGSRIDILWVGDISPHEYIYYLKKGIQTSLGELSEYNIHFEQIPISNIYDTAAMREALIEAKRRSPDGVLLSPILCHEEYVELVRDLIRAGVIVELMVGEMDDLEDADSVTANWRMIGRLAAQALNWALPERSRVAVITTNKDYHSHAVTIEGFLSFIDDSRVSDVRIFENQDSKEITYLLTEQIIRETPDVGAIYVTSYNAVQVCNCIEANGMTGKIAVVGQDLYPELAEKLQTGQMMVSVFPNQYMIGHRAVRHLFNRITNYSNVISHSLVTPELISAANLECYAEYLKYE